MTGMSLRKLPFGLKFSGGHSRLLCCEPIQAFLLLATTDSSHCWPVDFLLLVTDLLPKQRFSHPAQRNLAAMASPPGSWKMWRLVDPSPFGPLLVAATFLWPLRGGGGLRRRPSLFPLVFLPVLLLGPPPPFLFFVIPPALHHQASSSGFSSLASLVSLLFSASEHMSAQAFLFLLPGTCQDCQLSLAPSSLVGSMAKPFCRTHYLAMGPFAGPKLSLETALTVERFLLEQKNFRKNQPVCCE